MTFNVLHEPWIPMSNGETVSLMDALRRAHELEGVLCTFPPETCAVYRLMIAFVMDALQLDDRFDRMDLLDAGRLDMGVIEEYVARCEQEGASFDLFDPKRPFMQTAFDAALDKQPISIAKIMLRMPSGNNHVFFTHAPQDACPPGEALRHLLCAYLFSTSGAQGYPSSVNNTPCVYVLHHGQTLFETLLLNAVSIKECGNIAYGKPAWRNDEAIMPKREFSNVDMLCALTWMPRRVTLLCEENGDVAQMYFQQGHNFKGNALWRDPHAPYRVLKNGEYNSLKPQQGRAFWRDLGTLFVSRESRYGKPPLVVENAPDTLAFMRLSLVGLITSQASLVDLQAEEMQLPSAILEDAYCGDTLREDLLFFEDCAAALRFAAKDYQNGVLTLYLQNTFFHLAHDYLYENYLPALASCKTDEDFIELQKQVHDEALRMIKETFRLERLRVGYDGKTLIAQTQMQGKALAVYYKKRRKRENDRQ